GAGHGPAAGVARGHQAHPVRRLCGRRGLRRGLHVCAGQGVLLLLQRRPPGPRAAAGGPPPVLPRTARLRRKVPWTGQQVAAAVSRWRIAVVGVLLAVPFVFLAGVGSYYLWQTGLGFKVWWGMAASMALGYCLAWYWQRKRQLLAPLDFTP